MADEWQFINKTEKEQGHIHNSDLKLFLYPKRIINSVSRKENIEILLKRDKIEHGVGYVDLLDLHNGLYKLRENGIVLQRPDIHSIAKLIEDHYYELPEIIETDEDMDVALNAMAQYIVIKEIEAFKPEQIGIELYCIKVDKFNEILNDGDLKFISKDGVRKWLQANGYTHCNRKRTTFYVRITGRPDTYVAFYKEKMDEIINKLEQQEQEK